MANFDKFWPILLKQEGYYANNPNDKGGETWEGIARNFYPSWSGWSIVDSYKGKPNFIANLKIDIILQSKVVQFYKSSQWDTLRADDIHNQSIANFLVDWGVNGGLTTPVKHAQKILNIVVDGKMGPQTIVAINVADGAQFFASLHQDRIDFYHAVVEAKPKNAEFLSGWLQRTNSFTYTP